MESQQRCIRTLTHQATSLTFSSDGKTLVSFSNNDKTANVWDVETGELKKTFTGLTSITLSLDGKTLADSNKDNTIKLWDVETGELKNSLTGHSSNILFIAFSPDGKTLVSRDEETIKFWNICTGKLKSSMAHSYNRKESIWRTTVFSPNGQTLAISSTRKREDGTFYKTITLWDVETGQVVRTLDDNYGSIAFSHDGKTLSISSIGKYKFSVSSPGGVDEYEETYDYTRLWDLTTGQIRKTFSDNRFCALSPDGGIFVAVEKKSSSPRHNGSISIIDVGTGQKIKSFPGTDAALSPNGKILAVSENGEALKLLNGSSGISIATLPGKICNFTFSPDGNILAVADGGTIKLWQESTEPIVKQQLHGGAYSHLKRLENLLAAELWEDADQETANVIKRFLSQDLNVVDQLWIHYSNGHYGFSVQKQIWEGVLRNEGRRMQMNTGLLDDLDQFEYCVGWGTIDSNPYYHGDNDEYFKTAWKKTKKGYYPREVHQENGSGTCTSSTALNQIFDKIRTVTDPPATIET
jgi:WD40 repeat protein